MSYSRRVLYLCSGNCAHWQMAQGPLCSPGGADVEVFSAGTDPRGNALAVEVMREIGIADGNVTSP